ncbi:endonuclease domain-containing protein [Bradyrhizobium liaoningense]
MFEELIEQDSIGQLVLDSDRGVISVLAGVDAAELHRAIDQVEVGPTSPRALFIRLSGVQTTEAAVRQLTDQLADTARRLWPVWFTDVSFAEHRNDALGRLAAAAAVRRVAAEIPGLQVAWADAAIELILDNRALRVRTPATVEVSQLALAISRYGLVLVVDAEQACNDSSPAAVIHVLEWVAELTQCAIVALFRTLPPDRPPFDRILYGARILKVERDIDETKPSAAATEPIWLAPWLGSPHPLSETEKRLEKALRSDEELALLFDCNQFVQTLRGSRPRVDFVWTAGRMVVELDGYGSHGNRTAFMYDRHRDYELTLTGYTVLRLANDEIAQDIGKAVEKIRDIVHLCRGRG